jgi:hypothetical protein
MDPKPPSNVRIRYPDGTVIPVSELAYRGTIGRIHVWQIVEPRWVRFDVRAVVECDDPDDDGQSHYIFPGMELPPNS